MAKLIPDWITDVSNSNSSSHRTGSGNNKIDEMCIVLLVEPSVVVWTGNHDDNEDGDGADGGDRFSLTIFIERNWFICTLHPHFFLFLFSQFWSLIRSGGLDDEWILQLLWYQWFDDLFRFTADPEIAMIILCWVVAVSVFLPFYCQTNFCLILYFIFRCFGF